MRAFEFIEPTGVVDAVRESARSGSRLIAGGSDLLGELKEGTVHYERLVSLAAIEGLRGVSASGSGLRIGALTTIAELASGPGLEGPYQIIAGAAQGVATPEVRNRATLGGNLCQRPRCLHYRHALLRCLKREGEGCPAADSPYQSYLSVFGGPGCFAVAPSDLAPPLIALDGRVEIAGPEGLREVPLEAFFAGPERDPRRENVLERGEVLTSVIVPPAPAGWHGVYSKSRTRNAGDFAIASLALGFEPAGGRVRGARVVLGGVAPVPRRCAEAEAVLEGEEPGEEVARRAAEAALTGATPLAHNAFKLDLVRALIVRSVARLGPA